MWLWRCARSGDVQGSTVQSRLNTKGVVHGIKILMLLQARKTSSPPTGSPSGARVLFLYQKPMSSCFATETTVSTVGVIAKVFSYWTGRRSVRRRGVSA
ncbi:hypothetical protein INR49_006405 [Caranx melampygus]|nr:hypothetical protein INR49_006405 [Caranx melampygus]